MCIFTCAAFTTCRYRYRQFSLSLSFYLLPSPALVSRFSLLVAATRLRQLGTDEKEWKRDALSFRHDAADKKLIESHHGICLRQISDKEATRKTENEPETRLTNEREEKWWVRYEQLQDAELCDKDAELMASTLTDLCQPLLINYLNDKVIILREFILFDARMHIFNSFRIVFRVCFSFYEEHLTLWNYCSCFFNIFNCFLHL